ncbi:MAG: polypeptide-transport-associated domain-containing protein [Gallionellaceae bacterium]|nr:MAG: polypeptide-transport-associated domain-containing protein [Gallionellaceae bacterium]
MSILNTSASGSRLSLLLLGALFFSPTVQADDLAASGVAATAHAVEEAPAIIRFAINAFIVDDAQLLTQADFDAVVAPFVGKEKDFSDVQRALEAVEELYASRGYSAVHVLLPEQELEAGTVHFQVIEGHYGKIAVKDNKFVSEQNALNALPSLRSGGVPRAREVARQLKMANENPARQLNVVLKAGEKDNEVDASVLVADSKPDLWTVTFDNSGSLETGRSRLGLAYRHANVFDKDHVAQVNMQVSPSYMSRVKVLGGSYKVPLYDRGHSVEFFGGYSNVNSLVGETNFQGGGLIFSSRYNIPLDRWGTFDPRLTFGLDWRKFDKIKMAGVAQPLYNDIVVTPISVGYSAQGKAGKGDVNFNTSFALNVPLMGKGKSADFANYDFVNFSKPTATYKAIRFGAGYFTVFGGDWQFRTAMNGQWSGDTLIQAEQMRLGGADGVRGFSEGSETGEVGVRYNIETYSPALETSGAKLRGLVFLDGGGVKAKAGGSTDISSAGFGLRTAITETSSLRLDAGRIIKAGNDPQQLKGDWRIHAALMATF